MKSALIAGVVAAIVAAASSTAATIVVTSKSIKNGTIQTVDISAKAQRALKGKRGAPGAAGARGPVGAQGAQGAQGSQGPAGIQRLRFIVSPPTIIPGGTEGTADAACPAGETAVSGGYLLTGAEAAVFQSVGIGTAWRARAENSTGADATLIAYAYCSPGVAVQ